jgi:glutathione synthase
MTHRLGVVMDPLSSIHYKKDSTLAMLWEAADRGYELYFFQTHDLFLRDGIAFGRGTQLQVKRDPQQWHELKAQTEMPLSDLNIILMRKDPPFDQEYIYTTYILEQAERQGTLVVNRPQSLRDANEKLFTAFFPDCIPPMLVTSSIEKLREFWQEQGDIVCKPLDAMGGTSIFRLQEKEVNANVIFETLTKKETTFIVAQKYIPDIKAGDKRIILINGEPVPHALARIPQGNDWRGNLAAGAKGVVQPLTKRDQFICTQIAPLLRDRGLYFVGIDVIGDYLTEINVTSPTGIRELDDALGINISKQLFDVVEQLSH